MSSIEEQKIYISIVNVNYNFATKIIEKYTKNYIYKGPIHEPAGYAYDAEDTENFIVDKKDAELIMEKLEELGVHYSHRKAILVHRWD